MRFLGFVFVIALVLVVFGYFRGWFGVTTTHASGKSEVTLGVDSTKIGEDTKAAAAELGRLSAKAMAAVKSLATEVTAEESALEATIETIDHAGRDLRVVVGSDSIDLHVASSVSVTRDGVAVAFDQLQPATRAKLVFKRTGDDRELVRVEILG